MKKLLSLIAGMLLLSTALVSCAHNNGSDAASEPQIVMETVDGGRLYLYVETDKTSYDYDDVVYITATLVNRSDETVTFYIPDSETNMHRGLSVNIENGGYEMVDVDYSTSLANFPLTGTEDTFTLSPNEKYTQNMRLSTRHFMEYSFQNANSVLLTDVPPVGTYDGTVTAYEVSGDEQIPRTVQFQVEIKPTNVFRQADANGNKTYE